MSPLQKQLYSVYGQMRKLEREQRTTLRKIGCRSNGEEQGHEHCSAEIRGNVGSVGA